MSKLPIFQKHHFFLFPHQNLKLSSLSLPKKPSTSSPSRWVRMSSTTTTTTKKIVVIMGPTGCGKSKLSVDLATNYFPNSEIINSDKIQVYRGLDITTNKIPLQDRKDVPHHLLGEFDSSESHPEFTPSDFRSSASFAISQILSRRRIPFVVGGSNSFVYALLAKKFNPELDVFKESSSDSVFCKELRYKCCFIWVDVSLPVLNRYLVKRVDDMLDSGMYEELSEYFSVSRQCGGLKKAIGVPEFERYFIRNNDGDVDDELMLYEEAVREIKDNTCQLAKRQVGKILRLRDAAGWDLKRVDATAAVGGGGGKRVWERQVLEPSVKIVNRFLMES